MLLKLRPATIMLKTEKKDILASARRPEKAAQESENALTHLEKKAALLGGFCVIYRISASLGPVITTIALKAIIPKSL